MTLIFERAVEQPATHVFVLGCGRFAPRIDGRPGNRPSAVAGARAMIEFFLENQDRFVAPIASIECLLSDPALPAGQDRLLLPKYADDPRSADFVGAATSANLVEAGDAWLNRCRKGDQLLVYVCSHGLSNSDSMALALLEDTFTRERDPYANTLNLTVLANGMPVVGEAPCWAFFDACQEVCPDLMNRVKISMGIGLLNPLFAARNDVHIDTFALAASRRGQPAWAPKDGGPPYFTQTLLRAMSGANVEPVEDKGWLVTAYSLLRDLDLVAAAAFGYYDLIVQPVGSSNARVEFIKPAEPKVPVAVHTRCEVHMLDALEVVADGGGDRVHARVPDGKAVWRFGVDPGERQYTVRATFPPEIGPYQEGRFVARPSARIVELVR